jgi:carbon storage regulator
MLVIARRIGQTFLIGDDVEITVSAVRGDQVRLAIKAPRNITILRSEVVDQVAQGNAAAIGDAKEMMRFLEEAGSQTHVEASAIA